LKRAWSAAERTATGCGPEVCVGIEVDGNGSAAEDLAAESVIRRIDAQVVNDFSPDMLLV